MAAHTSGSTEALGTLGQIATTRQVTLLVRWGAQAQVIPLGMSQSRVIGRRTPSDIVIESQKLSREHARFHHDDSGLWVEDLGSRNGTLLEGEPIQRAHLRAGDSLLLGDVQISVHVFEPSTLASEGIMSHGRFVTLLEAEAVRTRVLSAHAALILASPREKRIAEEFLPEVKRRLKRTDAVSLYSPQVLEILLPETDESGSRALSLGEALREMGFNVGGALLPDCAQDPHDLLSEALLALRQAKQKGTVHFLSRSAPRSLGDIEEAPYAESVTMRNLFRLVRNVAQSVIPVLIQGETGTGKELIARALHDQSQRATGPLVTINCGALPPQLVEATLFGHERGAFTGAERMKKGVFEEAHGGTLFLDEVGELPASAQASLLRALENGVIMRVGSTREISVDVRIVAASHRRLEIMCQDGSFRQDLLFRLNVMTLFVPPLREHPEDIEGLAHRFLERAANTNQRSVAGFTPEALTLLQDYSWPGNIRELKNEVERAVIVCLGDRILSEDLSERVRSATRAGVSLSKPGPEVGGVSEETTVAQSTATTPRSLRNLMHAYERKVLIEALAACDGNQTLTAEYLDMPRRTLVHKIRLHGINSRTESNQ